ncbi:hypothetical protein HC931_21660 [Candidatus Gracilibacteria bacterium]|nr:hypothetical protein [Candidatus Gracilibacteria bacterium]NJP20795.1 hypothetical protein [Hydrococcus sp. CRU_1_1]
MSEEQQQSPSVNPTPSNTSGNGYSQTEIVELLQKTISQLDRIVNQLNAESTATLPPKATVETLVASTKALAASLDKTEVPQPPKPVTKEVPTTPTVETIPTKIDTSSIVSSVASVAKEITEELPPQTKSWWERIFDKIRAVLPAPLQDKLSNGAIAGILGGAIAAVLLTSVLLLTPQPSTEIGELPPETASETSPEATPTISETPEAIETPPELKAPGRPEPVEVIPPPEPELTPEQSLIASIQDRVASLTSQYPEGLVLSVQANFLGSRLIVTVGDEWYKLNPNRQDKLANSILQRSQQLDFRKLEIVNTQGTVLARNPVVGNKMVIIQREV